MRILAVSLLSWILMGAQALSDQIVLPTQGIQRGRAIEVTYRLPRPTIGKGVLSLEWRDTLDRLVERREMPVELLGDSALHFGLDLRHAAALGNALHVRLSLDGNRKSEAQIAFSVPPADEPWRDYEIIMWQEQTALQYTQLKNMGVTAAAVPFYYKGDPEHFSQTQLEALVATNLRWYIENVATDFYSAYHRWSPDRPVDWRFQEIKRLYRENPKDPAAFNRSPSLSDETWLTTVRDRVVRTARAQDVYRPVFYNLADEPGIGDLSAFWDFDLSLTSLAQMRIWLRERYGTLAALNREWASHFRRWDLVVPMATSEAIARPDDNYAAWADFKEWMDEAFAHALRRGAEAVHSVNARAYAAIEGAQIPGWGGYDYSRLAHAVDVIELYDAGGNLEILRSLNPRLVLLTTLPVGDAGRTRGLWRELLRGTRGVILWDREGALVGSDGTLGQAAYDLADDFREIRAGIGALLINSRPVTEPIALLYSPASMRTEWLLDWKPKGNAWAERDLSVSFEDENAVRSSMMGYLHILEQIGLHPRLVTPAGLEQGELDRHYRLLVLPKVLALSRGEAAAIRRFVERGGVVVADDPPGSFDEHGRRRARPILRDIFPGRSDAISPGQLAASAKRSYLTRGAASCTESAAGDACGTLIAGMREILRRHEIGSPIKMQRPGDDLTGGVQSYRFRNGDITILALQRDPATQRSGSGAAEAEILLTLPRASFVCDLRERRLLRRSRELKVALPASAPSLFAVSAAAPPGLSVQGPSRIRTGEIAEFHLALAGTARAKVDVFHVDVVSPSGTVFRHYGGNLLAVRGRALLQIPIALNDPTGTWTIQVHDLLGCDVKTATIGVMKD